MRRAPWVGLALACCVSCAHSFTLQARSPAVCVSSRHSSIVAAAHSRSSTTRCAMALQCSPRRLLRSWRRGQETRFADSALLQQALQQSQTQNRPAWLAVLPLLLQRARSQLQQTKNSLTPANRGSKLAFGAIALFLSTIRMGSKAVHAMHVSAPVGGVDIVPMESSVLASRLALWFVLFSVSAAFHAAEIAITTLYPWKVRRFRSSYTVSSVQKYNLMNGPMRSS